MSFAVSLSLLAWSLSRPDGGSVLVALFPRPYAKWFSVLGAAVSTVCTIALAANFAGAGMPRHAGPPDLVWADPRHGIHF